MNPKSLQFGTDLSFIGQKPKEPLFTDINPLQAGRELGEIVDKKIGQPLVKTFTKAADTTYNTINKAINPGTTFLTPKLTEYGFNPKLAFGIGLGVDILAPGPGEFGRAKKLFKYDAIAKKIDNTDRSIMYSFIDGDKNVASAAQRIADEMNLPNRFKGDKSLKEDFIKILDADKAANKKKFNVKKINTQSGMIKNPFGKKPELPAYEGSTDLTLKTLEKLKGRTTVSKQYISDLTNSADIKQAEREAIRNALEGYKTTVPVKEFAEKVQSELLPLKSDNLEGGLDRFNEPTRSGRYENIALPDELRGPVADYRERIYQSPIKTSAGDVHFTGEDAPNYFAHTRIEDLPANPTKVFKDGKIVELPDTDDPTRRVIEIQSDLFQKGRLEMENKMSTIDNSIYTVDETMRQIESAKEQLKTATTEMRRNFLQQRIKELESSFDLGRRKELSKLEPYRNTWHERVIREEVKQAAKDGKTKLQFPTGETAMKIEGLGQSEVWSTITNRGTVANLSTDAVSLKPGMTVFRAGERGQNWIITDVLGDGKFKAIPKQNITTQTLENLKKTGRLEGDGYTRGADETFDISGKVDTNNPIYRFYEKEVGKYLTNKYKAKRVTDKRGVTWWELPVTKEQGNMPIEAFGAFAGFGQDEEGNFEFDPEKAAVGLLATKAMKKKKGKFKKKEPLFKETKKEERNMVRSWRPELMESDQTDYWPNRW